MKTAEEILKNDLYWICVNNGMSNPNATDVKEILYSKFKEFSDLQNKELVEANERLTKQRHTLADENIQYKSELSDTSQQLAETEKDHDMWRGKAIQEQTKRKEIEVELSALKKEKEISQALQFESRKTRKEKIRELQSTIQSLKEEVEGLKDEMKMKTDYYEDKCEGLYNSWDESTKFHQSTITTQAEEIKKLKEGIMEVSGKCIFSSNHNIYLKLQSLLNNK